MSFRWKAIGFIASVEGLFTIAFAFIVVNVMQGMIEDQFLKRAQVSAQLFATTTQEALLTSDLASLDSFVEQVLENPDILYARVRDNQQVLAQASQDHFSMNRLFKEDQDLLSVDDRVFDTYAEIQFNGESYGRVEIGLNTTLLERTVSLVRWKVIGVGVGEIFISAVVSYLLGSLLVKQLSRLQQAARAIAQGDMSIQIPVKGQDELAETSAAFNRMSQELDDHVQQLQDRNRQLKTARNHLQGVLDTALNGIVTITEDGIIEQVNPHTEKIFGFSRQEMLGQNIAMLIPHPHNKYHNEYLKLFLKTGRSQVLGSGREVIGQTKAGLILPIWLAVSELPEDGEDGLRRFVGVIADISDQKEAERKLIEAKEVAEAANQAKTDFLHVMSHELRTPLQGAKGPLQEFKDQFKDFEGMWTLEELNDQLTAAQQAVLQTAMQQLHDEVQTISAQGLRSADHLLHLIEEILDFARIEAGKLKVEPTTIEPHTTVQDVLEINRHLAESKGLALNSQLPDHLSVYVDPLRFKQVLLNLVGNAVKFTELGSITLTAQSQGDLVQFEVIDTGCGIPADQLQTIFTPFEQVDNSATRQSGGTGLGLAITRKLLHCMNGTLEVQSDVGVGSRFILTLPSCDTATQVA
ncbi:ATP-binding protein [Magnetococcus sp. PR-3]|uniref:ATP-binding protein n=1 Tax=Magnetococcus sp. PR-3 TaxID=3120355 RepID=UPI002FCE27FB